MSGADSILRVLGATVAAAVIIITSWIGVRLMDPFTKNMPAPAESLGWPAFGTIYEFMTLGLVGLSLVVFVWLILGRVRQDTRQELQPRGPF